MEDHSLSRLEVRAAGSKGKGVFTLSPIAAGQLVVRLTGEILKSAELTDDMLALQLGPDLWLCSDGSRLDDMVNHSCEPNTGFADGTPVLYALREIAAGEEITWDYSTSLSEAGWTLACDCGTTSCRGMVAAWGELPTETRDRLRPIALGYLRAS